MKHMETYCSIRVSGFVHDPLVFSHESYGEKFDKFYIESRRESGYIDRLPCVVSRNLSERIGSEKIMIIGSVRTLNRHLEDRNVLDVFIFVESIMPDESNTDENDVVIDGIIAKQKEVRATPLGRIIADLTIAINRDFGKSDYLPCIAWGRIANMFHMNYVGRKVNVHGRLQSRDYEKRIADGTVVTRTCYEVSVFTIELREDEREKVNESEVETDAS